MPPPGSGLKNLKCHESATIEFRRFAKAHAAQSTSNRKQWDALGTGRVFAAVAWVVNPSRLQRQLTAHGSMHVTLPSARHSLIASRSTGTCLDSATLNWTSRLFVATAGLSRYQETYNSQVVHRPGFRHPRRMS